MLEYLKEQDRIKKLLNELLNPGWFDTVDEIAIADEISEWHKTSIPKLGEMIRVKTLPRRMFPKVKPIMDIWDVVRDTTISAMYVHGSYSTGDNVESSDLDLTYLLPNETAKDPLMLLKLRYRLSKTTKHFKEIDHLQHHGPYILTHRMLQTYLECYLPLDVWLCSTPLMGPELITFHTVKSAYHDKLWFEKSVEYYMDMAKTTIYLSSEYDRKRFVCMACMIPCVLYPWATGKYTTKEGAIKWMLGEYPWCREWVDELTEMRKNNNYEHIEDLVKVTGELCRRIKYGR